jgi:hypothetical protein
LGLWLFGYLFVGGCIFFAAMAVIFVGLSKSPPSTFTHTHPQVTSQNLPMILFLPSSSFIISLSFY